MVFLIVGSSHIPPGHSHLHRESQRQAGAAAEFAGPGAHERENAGPLAQKALRLSGQQRQSIQPSVGHF